MKRASHWRFPSVAVALARATLALLATTGGGAARATAQAPNLAKAIDAYIAGEMALDWPSGDRSPIIPLDRDHAIDRSYWEPIAITRDAMGRATAISYDRFTGTRAPDAAP
jgi:hypothetical protein